MYLSSSTTFFLPPKPFVRLSSEFEAQLAVLGWSRASSSRMKVGPGHYMREGSNRISPGIARRLPGMAQTASKTRTPNPQRSQL